MPPKAIPDRWIPYKACGEVIEGTRIICFKVPLKLSVQKNVREIEKIWDIPTVLADIPRLGAVIDLTNTARYYNPMDFLKANVLHRKILMPGRVVPPESSVQEFMNTLDEFLTKNSESLVGVHCTHGLNRTGYMVCRYMRDRMGIPAEEAITKFETARGYKMERDIYRNSILGKPEDTIGDGKEPEVIPVKPRRDDVNYRSPLDYFEDPNFKDSMDSKNRFGNRGSPSVESRNRFGNRDNPSFDSRNRFGNKGNPSSDSRNRFGNRDNSSVDGRNRFGNRDSPNTDSQNRFANRPNSDRYSSNRFSNQRNANSDRTASSSALFSCYTERYKNDRDFSARAKGDIRKTNMLPVSWRNSGEGSADTRRQANYNVNRNEDRPRSNYRPRENDISRPNDNTKFGNSSRYERPMSDRGTRSGL